MRPLTTRGDEVRWRPLLRGQALGCAICRDGRKRLEVFLAAARDVPFPGAVTDYAANLAGQLTPRGRIHLRDGAVIPHFVVGIEAERSTPIRSLGPKRQKSGFVIAVGT